MRHYFSAHPHISWKFRNPERQ